MSDTETEIEFEPVWVEQLPPTKGAFGGGRKPVWPARLAPVRSGPPGMFALVRRGNQAAMNTAVNGINSGKYGGITKGDYLARSRPIPDDIAQKLPGEGDYGLYVRYNHAR